MGMWLWLMVGMMARGRRGRGRGGGGGRVFEGAVGGVVSFMDIVRIGLVWLPLGMAGLPSFFLSAWCTLGASLD